MDPVDVPVVERRQGILGSAASARTSAASSVSPDRRSAIPYVSRPSRFRGASRGLPTSGSGRPSKPVENTTSVSVENTWVVVWTCRTTSPRCSMSRARILRM